MMLNMTVGDLIKILSGLPADAALSVRKCTNSGDKMMIVAEGHELDPICQFRQPTIVGFGPDKE